MLVNWTNSEVVICVTATAGWEVSVVALFAS